MRELEAAHGLDDGVLGSAMTLAYELSDAGCGAILTLGDARRVVSFARKVPPLAFKWGLPSLKEDLLSISLLARQDGATVIDEAGRLVQPNGHSRAAGARDRR